MSQGGYVGGSGEKEDRLQLGTQSIAASCALLAWREEHADLLLHHLRPLQQTPPSAQLNVTQQPATSTCSGQFYKPHGINGVRLQYGCHSCRRMCVCKCVCVCVCVGIHPASTFVRISVSSCDKSVCQGSRLHCPSDHHSGNAGHTHSSEHPKHA